MIDCWLLVLDQLLDCLKLLFDSLLDTRFKHNELSFASPQSVTLALEQEDFLSEGVIGFEQLLLSLLANFLRLFDLRLPLRHLFLQLVKFEHTC